MTNIDASVSTSGKWLSHGHLQGREHVVTIVDTTNELMDKDDPQSTKIVLWFDGKPLGLGLNVTNKQVLIDAWGKMTDGWVGKQIVLYPTTCVFGNDPKKPCIRLRVNGTQPVPAIAEVNFNAPVQGAAGTTPDPIAESDIPF